MVFTVQAGARRLDEQLVFRIATAFIVFGVRLILFAGAELFEVDIGLGELGYAPLNRQVLGSAFGLTEVTWRHQVCQFGFSGREVTACVGGARIADPRQAITVGLYALVLQ